MEPPQVLVPGLQTVKESEVETRIHRLANIATVLANLQKERVPHLDKILAEEVRNNYKISGKHSINCSGGGRPSWIHSGFTLGSGELKETCIFLYSTYVSVHHLNALNVCR